MFCRHPGIVSLFFSPIFSPTTLALLLLNLLFYDFFYDLSRRAAKLVTSNQSIMWWYCDFQFALS